MNTHTPGPWVQGFKWDGKFHAFPDSGCVQKSDGHVITVSATSDPLRCNYADARLIAAAPEMLEALQKLDGVLPEVEDCEDADCDVCRAFGEMRSVIAKAAGMNSPKVKK